MAFRREVLTDVGGFDEKFRWYRTADIDWSFRVKDAGPRLQRRAAARDEARASRLGGGHRGRNARHGRSGTSTGSSTGTATAGTSSCPASPSDHDHDHDHEHHHDGPVTMPEGR